MKELIDTHTLNSVLLPEETLKDVAAKHEQSYCKADWLQIYCALIAGNKEMDSKSNVVDQTDLLYDLYQQRWNDA
jgi:hypothetical protein